MAEAASIREWFTGEDKTLSFTVTDENDQPWVLTGRELVWVLQGGASSPTALLTKTGADIEIDGTNTNVCKVAVSHDDTAELAAGRYFHALVCVEPGEFAVLAYGDVRFRKSPPASEI